MAIWVRLKFTLIFPDFVKQNEIANQNTKCSLEIQSTFKNSINLFLEKSHFKYMLVF